MRVLESRVTGLAYNADFGRVEADVSLIVKSCAGRPARTVRIRTSQPLTGTSPLEQRLKDDAIRLASALAA